MCEQRYQNGYWNVRTNGKISIKKPGLSHPVADLRELVDASIACEWNWVIWRREIHLKRQSTAAMVWAMCEILGKYDIWEDVIEWTIKKEVF